MRDENEIENAVRDSYDRLADEYARRLFHELDHKPLDRELLGRFARSIPLVGTTASAHVETVASAVRARKQVCDLGCGPGQIARYLHDLGCDVFGLDLSPRMIETARRLSPDVPFREGNMLALDLPDNSMAGIAAFYAIVNIPKPSLPVVFREILRVLQPGGLLLLSFHIGDEVLTEEQLWGYKISMQFYLFPTPEIQAYLESVGLQIEDIIEREPYSPDVEYQSRRAYIFARKAL